MSRKALDMCSDQSWKLVKTHNGHLERFNGGFDQKVQKFCLRTTVDTAKGLEERGIENLPIHYHPLAIMLQVGGMIS